MKRDRERERERRGKEKLTKLNNGGAFKALDFLCLITIQIMKLLECPAGVAQ